MSQKDVERCIYESGGTEGDSTNKILSDELAQKVKILKCRVRCELLTFGPPDATVSRIPWPPITIGKAPSTGVIRSFVPSNGVANGMREEFESKSTGLIVVELEYTVW